MKKGVMIFLAGLIVIFSFGCTLSAKFTNTTIEANGTGLNQMPDVPSADENTSLETQADETQADETQADVTLDANLSVEEEEVASNPVPDISAPEAQTHTVNLIDGGFEVPEVRINVGDTVVWQNIREGRYTRGMVIGTQQCARIKSGFFDAGSVFQWTFTGTGTCNFADGIYTKQFMKVIVE